MGDAKIWMLHGNKSRGCRYVVSDGCLLVGRRSDMQAGTPNRIHSRWDFAQNTRLHCHPQHSREQNVNTTMIVVVVAAVVLLVLLLMMMMIILLW